MRLPIVVLCLVALFAAVAQAQDYSVVPAACEQALPEPVMSACEPAMMTACEPAYAPLAPAPTVMMMPMFNQVARYYAVPRAYSATSVWTRQAQTVYTGPLGRGKTKDKQRVRRLGGGKTKVKSRAW